jgi:uncharacterized membrane-anchored protein YitT (DUF2179 family)
MFFEGLRRKRVQRIVEKVRKRGLLKRYLLLVIGCFIVALAFNVFFLKYNIVCFGISGLSIVVNQFGVNPSLFILIVNIILLVVSYFTLGIEDTKNSVVGSLIFPVFTTLTEGIANMVNLDNVELLLVAVLGAVLTGIGYGIIFKTGFTTGGTDIVDKILAKYTKISMGKAMIIVDGLVVVSAKLVFSWEIVLYGFIVLYIISYLTDKMLLGISESKAFYIVTEKEEEIRDYLINGIHSGVTMLSARGGYTNDKESMILTVVPTRDYYVVKEGIKTIDSKAFFLVCDAYEVSNRGKKNEVI